MRLRNLERSVQKHSGTFVSATDRLIAKKIAEAAEKAKQAEQPVEPKTES